MRSALAFVLFVAIALGLAACGREMVWNGPGWYLEKPHVTIVGRDYYIGPVSYDDCELARKKETTADLLLCVNELQKPE